jgi:hypothetical protein
MHVFADWYDGFGLRFWFADDYRSDFLVARFGVDDSG